MDWAEAAASRVGEPPELPTVAVAALRALDGKTGFRAGDVHDLLKLDRQLEQRILRMTDSRVFGLGSRLANTREALAALGRPTFGTLLMTAAMQPFYRTTGTRLQDLLMWEHAVGTAVAARLIAARLPDVSPERAFVAGLLHDVGKVVLDHNLERDYERVLRRVFDGGATFFQAENELLGFDHADVSGLVARRWELSEPTVTSIRLHHRPGRAEDDARCCAVVSLASSLCSKLEIGPDFRPDLVPTQLAAATRLGFDEDAEAGLCRDLLALLGSDQETLGIDLPTGEAARKADPVVRDRLIHPPTPGPD